MAKKIPIIILILILFVGGYLFYPKFQQSEPPPAPKSASDETYTLDDVATHNTKDNCWQVIDGAVYDLTPYLASEDHPGGAAMAKDCGTDASFTYKNDPPHSEYAHSLLPEYAIGVLK